MYYYIILYYIYYSVLLLPQSPPPALLLLLLILRQQYAHNTVGTSILYYQVPLATIIPHVQVYTVKQYGELGTENSSRMCRRRRVFLWSWLWLYVLVTHTPGGPRMSVVIVSYLVFSSLSGSSDAF